STFLVRGAFCSSSYRFRSAFHGLPISEVIGRNGRGSFFDFESRSMAHFRLSRSGVGVERHRARTARKSASYLASSRCSGSCDVKRPFSLEVLLSGRRRRRAPRPDLRFQRSLPILLEPVRRPGRAGTLAEKSGRASDSIKSG